MTTNSLTIRLSTVTPIWTGGADGKDDQLHMTGIIGSLRWWYEAIVRGIGGRVCDPTNANKPKCSFDSKKPETFKELCDVCRLFGATGWARRFRLIVSEENLRQEQPAASTIDNSGRRVFRLSRDHRVNRDPKWYLSSGPLSGNITLEIIPTAPLDQAGKECLDPNVIGGLIQLIADRASLGAKPQMGLGIVHVIDHQSTQPLLDHLKQVVALHAENNDSRDYHEYDELPSLHNMFFARVRVDQVPVTESYTFNLKYDLRGMFRQSFRDDNLRHTVMGVVRGNERQGAKIMMSYPYGQGTIRIWGWIPKIPRSPTERSTILDGIYDFLDDTYGNDFTYWLDFNLDKHGDVLKYLEEHILKEGE